MIIYFGSHRLCDWELGPVPYPTYEYWHRYYRAGELFKHKWMAGVSIKRGPQDTGVHFLQFYCDMVILNDYLPSNWIEGNIDFIKNYADDLLIRTGNLLAFL